jgi:hypothetical protein
MSSQYRVPVAGSPTALAVTPLRVLMLVLVLVGCKKKHHEAAEPDVRLAPPTVALPALACDAPLEGRGECARDADCGGSTCVLDPATATRDRESPALSCGGKIGGLAARERCSAGDACESGLCGLAGVCLAPCAGNEDCATGELCRPLEVRLEEGLAPVRACTRIAALPDDVRIAEPAHIAALEGDEVGTVQTPAGRGTSIIYLKAECEAQPILVTLHSRPNGQELFDFEKAFIDNQVALNPVVPSGRTPLLSMLVPNNPAVEAAPQGYELGVFVDRTSSAELVVASRDAQRKILDLSLFYVGGGESSVAGGFHPGAAPVADMISRLRSGYAALGLELGAVREYDVTGALREELRVIETEDVLDDQGNAIDVELVGLDRLFQLSAGVDDSGINLFLVSDMDFILGVSGGIPGALGVHGTPTSGVAVALDAAGDRAVAVVMHEIGHQMGLFHTSELDGRRVEPLGDTPGCGAERDSDGDGLLDPSECQGAGADNLMFWAGSGTKLSAQQREVLSRSLILR